MRNRKSSAKKELNQENGEEEVKSKSTKDYDTAIHAFLEEDFLEFLYKPHTLLGLFFTVCFLAYLSMGRGEATSQENVRVGLLACCVSFILYCVLQLRDGLLLRPHPILWRAVTGAAILYLMLLVFISTQDLQYVRHTLMPYLFDNSLGVLPDANTKIYAADCRLITPEDPSKGWRNFYDALFDIFAIAHSLGWMGKAVLFRDYWLLWALSFSWEVLEVSFQHLLPNFKECWWDHYLLDVLGCNLAGMVLGVWVCRHYARKKYNWTGVRAMPTTRQKVKRVLQQFTPFSWTNYSWSALTSWKRCIQVVLMLAFVELFELNAFFLKHALWVPPPCHVNIVRLLLLWSLSLPAVREYYSYIDDPNCRRMGSSLWLMVAIGSVETLIVVKFALQEPQMFDYPSYLADPVPDPQLVKHAWIVSSALFVLWMLLHFTLNPRNRPTNSRILSWSVDLLLIGSFLPLIYIAVVDFLDTWNHTGPAQG